MNENECSIKFLVLSCCQRIAKITCWGKPVHLKSNVPVKSKLRHPPIPPGQPPRASELLKTGLFKFLPLGAKKPFKCPTNSF